MIDAAGSKGIIVDEVCTYFLVVVTGLTQDPITNFFLSYFITCDVAHLRRTTVDPHLAVFRENA